ncbi:MAG TPA: oligoendopeptidase F [Clostridiales bacterium]|nr:oligoendopeptidase F [Clostridiales bacterium]
MDREQASTDLKWKLSDIYENHEKFDEDFQKLNKYLAIFEKFKGKLKNPDILLKYYNTSTAFGKINRKLYGYVGLNHDVDLNNNLYMEDEQRLSTFGAKYSKATAFVGPELAGLSNEYFEQLLKDERFKDYEYYIKEILENRKHILSKEQEEALSVMYSFSSGFDDVRETLTENDFKYKPVVVDGKNEELTESTYGKFLDNKNKKVRKEAYNNIYEVYKQFSKTLAINYINFVKLINCDINLRKYNSTFEMFSESVKIPQELFDNLIKNVDKNINLEQKYFKLLKKSTKIEDFGFEDVYQSLSQNINKKYSIDEQKHIVLKALSPLGKEYQNLLKIAYENNWIDFCTNKNKKSGGYMLGVYGVHPYVFLNDNGDYDSLSTLAHELGHAMHTYYSSKNQPYPKHDYDIFIAEIASTVNEILLNKYMIKNAKTNEEKLFYLDSYLQHFKGTVFRQTMFAEFEDFAHKAIVNDEILSEKILNDKYTELLKKHFANTVEIDDCIIHEWERIPHFYSPYYVYKYATSFISAVYIANSILEGKNNMIEKYREMLKSGCNGYPTEILAKAGIDLTKDETFEYSFNDMKKCLKEVEEILENKNVINK